MTLLLLGTWTERARGADPMTHRQRASSMAFPAARSAVATSATASCTAWMASVDHASLGTDSTSEAAPVADSSRPIGGLLDELDESATGAASEVESVPNDAWSTDAIHAVQDAVALVATALRAAGNAIADAR